MRSNALAFLLLAALLCVQTAYAATAAQSGSCPDEVAVRVQSCLDQVERDEAQLPTGPCPSSNWTCICTKQQGFVDCYTRCPDQMPRDAISFDQQNCAGQHEGITINGLGGKLMYTWSDLNMNLGGSPDPGKNSSTSSSSSDAHGIAVAPSSGKPTETNSGRSPSTSQSANSACQHAGQIEHLATFAIPIAFIASTAVTLLM